MILTTHSPSTVALAPEDSIFAIDGESHRVEKMSRSRALSLLTDGVPTLSVGFDDRRQVFVESRTDAGLYDKLYQRVKANLDSDRSLVFVEVGRTDSSGGEQNAGCEQVERLVESLAVGGNKSVIGLVDWDGSRTNSNRTFVLSPGLRDGLESLLLDPALLVPLVIHTRLPYAKEKGIARNDESYASLLAWDTQRWQAAVNAIQDLLLGTASGRVTTQVNYCGGMSLQIAQDILHMDDHALEGLIEEKFGFLQPLNRRAGALMNHVVDTILPDFPHLLPADLLDTFVELLNAEFIDESEE